MKFILFPIYLIPIIMQAQNFPSIANRSVVIDQQSIAYKDEGQGQVILCLHAVGHSSKDFEFLYTLSPGRYRVISVDFPGHGESGKGSESISASYFERVMKEFIYQLDLKEIILVGNSIGGATAIRLAAQYPNKIKSLVLNNPGGLDKRDWIAPIFLNFMVRFFKKGVDHKKQFGDQFKKYYQKVLVTANSAERRNEIIKDAYFLAPMLVEAWTSFKSKQEDLRPMIEDIECPVLFGWCMKDKFIQFKRNKKSIDLFRNKTVKKYEAGHTPYVECPDLFLNDFVQFINSQ